MNKMFITRNLKPVSCSKLCLENSNSERESNEEFVLSKSAGNCEWTDNIQQTEIELDRKKKRYKRELDT